ncbi:MAG: hypothetical protein O3C40_13860 [Planctomycetota bacterium]|nr:hypothetical protein [Planctomycetota bacterium]
MAWRPADWVLEGELDNTTPGWTIGWIRLQGRDEPLRLKLLGNCHPDLAGWKFRIVRTDPIPEWVEPNDYAGIATDQSGTIGDVTADQMLQHYECSSGEFVRLAAAGNRPTTTLRKALYLEWFSQRNGRVVIQCTRLAVERLGERAFELTEEQWIEQAKQNNEEMTFFMHQLGDALDTQLGDDGSPNESDS